MNRFKEFIADDSDEEVEELYVDDDTELDTDMLDESGSISSGMAIKKHHNLIKLGREVIKTRTSTYAERQLARMLVEVGHLTLMSVAVSGEQTALSQIAKGATLRKL